MDSYEEAVRHVAHLIWVEEGEPDGRAAAHWAMAEQIFRDVEQTSAMSTPATGPDDTSDTGGVIFPDAPLAQKMPYAGKIVAILGIGALSATYVVILSALGFTVRLWADPAHRTQYRAMQTKGSVDTAASVKGSFRVTFCDKLVDALRDAEMVFATTPTYALTPLFREMKTLYDGPLASSFSNFTSLFIVPACLEAPGARLIFGRPDTLRIYEVSSATITAKWDSVAVSTQVKKMKASLEYAVLGRVDEGATELVKKIFVNPTLTPQSMLELFLNSPGSRVHQMGIVAGLNLIQQRHANPNARYYRDIVGSDPVGDLLVRFETDLFRIAAAWGIAPKPLVQWFNDTYPPPTGIPAWPAVSDWARWNDGPHNAQSMIPNPAYLDAHRFILEDGRHSCRLEKIAQLAGMAPEEYACVTEVVNKLSKIVGKDIRESAGLADIGLDRCNTKAEFLALLI
jgi:hypothetical protein